MSVHSDWSIAAVGRGKVFLKVSFGPSAIFAQLTWKLLAFARLQPSLFQPATDTMLRRNTDVRPASTSPRGKPHVQTAQGSCFLL